MFTRRICQQQKDLAVVISAHSYVFGPAKGVSNVKKRRQTVRGGDHSHLPSPFSALLTTSHTELLASCFQVTQLQRRKLKFWFYLLMSSVVFSISNTRRLTLHQGRELKPYTAHGFLQDVIYILPLVIQSEKRFLHHEIYKWM